VSRLLKPEQISELVSELECLLQEGIEYITTQYSGRGMRGRRCLGIVTKNDHYVTNTIAFHLGQHAENPQDMISCFSLQFQNPSIDDMGLSTIVYYPELLTEINMKA